jgi:hypothetical protein
MHLVKLSLYACGLSTVLLSAIFANAVFAPVHVAQPQRASIETSTWTTVVTRGD